MASSILQLSLLLCVALLSVVRAIPIEGLLNKLKQYDACCKALNYYLPGKVAGHIDAQYSISQLSFWSAQEQSLRPNCIVIPTSTQDVSTAVTILATGSLAGIPGCSFAVRGAGHTPFAGAANIEGGVTIDMQSMNQVTVSGDAKIVSIGPGNRWGNVYRPLDELNLVMVGGRASTVGAAGLLTGGGVSYFSGRYGFACDNIVAYEVVLGNGTVVTATQTSNSDLFRALKGASNNFGIVTRFDAKLFEQQPFWGGTISQPVSNKAAIFDYFAKFSSSANYDPFSGLITNFVWFNGLPFTILHTVTYTNGAVTWPPPAFQPLDAMPKISSTIRKAPLSNIADELATTTAAVTGRQNSFNTVTFVNDPAKAAQFMSLVHDLANATVADLFTVAGLAFTLTFQPLPYSLYSKGPTSNVLGLDRSQTDYINVLFPISWTVPTDNARVYARMQQLEGDILAAAKAMGLFNEYIYLNYAAQWQKPIRSYGEANVAFLKGVSRQYDPAGVFQTAVPGGFKLTA